MKYIKYLLFVLLTLTFFANNIFAQNEEIPDLSIVKFMPENAKVLTGGHIQLRVVEVTAGKTSEVQNSAFENWLVNGKPDPEHLKVEGDVVIYSPGDTKPVTNPVAVTCQFKNNKAGEILTTVVANVTVIDDESGFMIDDAYYPVNPTYGLFTTEKGATALTFIKGTMGVAISFTGKSKGTLDFSQDNAIGINMGSTEYASADQQGNPTKGFIEVTEYGEVGKLIKVNVIGIITDGNGGTHYLNGTFIIPRAPDA